MHAFFGVTGNRPIQFFGFEDVLGVLTVYSEPTLFKCKSYSLQRHVCRFIVVISVSICGPDKDNAERLLRHHSVHELVLLEFHDGPSCAIIERHDLNQ